MDYHCANTPGGTCVFTVNLADRDSDTLVRHIETLRTAMTTVRKAHPFKLLAMVVLPEHLHAIWRLPAGDANFALRWSLIKSGFSRSLPRSEAISPSRQNKGERGIWQWRYWEHQIRHPTDLERHIDYIHYNPVKHGWVKQPTDWPHSTLHAYIERGIVVTDWGRS
ncbi:MAG TPA: transposase [Candidatus Accumulibacter phosphatis]|nr:transposase [Accumulibacter sp.]HRF10638.1 transposase [Candidatus Accumulibacter phosphatis]